VISRQRLSAAIVLATLALPFAALAHHSFSMFDPVKEIILKGTVTEFQWTNPHTWIELDVVDDKGKKVHWSIEGGSVRGLARQGWQRTTIKPGDKIELVAHPLRDGRPGGSLMGITLADGRHFGDSLTAEGVAGAKPAAP